MILSLFISDNKLYIYTYIYEHISKRERTTDLKLCVYVL